MSAPAGPWTGLGSLRCSTTPGRATRSRLCASTDSDAPSANCWRPSRCSARAASTCSGKINTASAAGELVFHVFGAIAHFERRLIAKRTKDGIAAARTRGKRPGRQPLNADKIAAALKLVQAGLSPTAAARQVGLGRSTVYRELGRAGVERVPQLG